MEIGSYEPLADFETGLFTCQDVVSCIGQQIKGLPGLSLVRPYGYDFYRARISLNLTLSSYRTRLGSELFL